MNRCFCCGQTLTQEFRQGKLTWWCRHCWQEMPDLEAIRLNSGGPVQAGSAKSLVAAA
jgi:hypothetical protein